MPRAQIPTSTPRTRSEHDFRQTHAEWETSVFDNAQIFTAVTWHPTHRGDRIRHEFPTFQDATQFVHQAPPLPQGRGWCVYAATPSGRSIVLDRATWPQWLAREAGAQR